MPLLWRLGSLGRLPGRLERGRHRNLYLLNHYVTGPVDAMGIFKDLDTGASAEVEINGSPKLSHQFSQGWLLAQVYYLKVVADSIVDPYRAAM